MKGFTLIPNWFYQSPEYRAGEKAMIGYLVSRSGTKKQCFPSLKKISEDMAIAESTAVSILKKLEAKGLIIKNMRTAESGGRVSNLYRVILEQP